ncbi:hypothetical protein [Umezawaea sp. Da 62-37]|uniref:hypothetical protein n=1 Tax=Umezawaea sp. Da 62-37 TaxID=3075927 RepID=UPI0028F6CDD5|nr:hypothetical protein [Umezawaea sp. Da 62-37]WNV83886.1 hypothetical protein RM788_37820 [Umezawaea sp. Da 62-37]
MPRLPKNFRIDWVSVEPVESRGYLPAGPDTAVPAHFDAHIQLGDPPAAVRIEVDVAADDGPAIVELSIKSNRRTPVTTSVLRQVLVDYLLQEAMNAATVPASVREEWLATLPPEHRGRAEHSGRAPVDGLSQGDRDAHTAAQIYAESVAAGSKSPAVMVSHTMNRSRPQVARYIRRARELGLLPPLGPPEGG